MEHGSQSSVAMEHGSHTSVAAEYYDLDYFRWYLVDLSELNQFGDVLGFLWCEAHKRVHLTVRLLSWTENTWKWCKFISDL